MQSRWARTFSPIAGILLAAIFCSAQAAETIDVNLSKGKITAKSTTLNPGDFLNICSRDEGFHQPYSVSPPNQFGSAKAKEKDLLAKGQCRLVEVKNKQANSVEMTVYDRFNPQASLILKVNPKPQAAAPTKTDPAKSDTPTFISPMQGKQRLAYCYAPNDGCGRKAADGWCQRKGFKGAKDWVKYPSEAKPQAGRYLGSDVSCPRGQCETFESITCRTGPPTFF